MKFYAQLDNHVVKYIGEFHGPYGDAFNAAAQVIESRYDHVLWIYDEPGLRETLANMQEALKRGDET